MSPFWIGLLGVVVLLVLWLWLFPPWRRPLDRLSVQEPSRLFDLRGLEPPDDRYVRLILADAAGLIEHSHVVLEATRRPACFTRPHGHQPAVRYHPLYHEGRVWVYTAEK